MTLNTVPPDLPTVPTLMQGSVAYDDRGSVSFVNEFDFRGVKRSYIVRNHREGFVRAWHGHRREAKYVSVVSGAALVAAVQIDDWDEPSPDLFVHRYVLAAARPAVLYIPAGYANGFMSLTADAQLVFYSTSTVDESRGDDVRFNARRWDCWHVEER